MDAGRQPSNVLGINGAWAFPQAQPEEPTKPAATGVEFSYKDLWKAGERIMPPKWNHAPNAATGPGELGRMTLPAAAAFRPAGSSESG